MKCPNCGSELSPGQFCPQCGKAAPAFEAPLPPQKFMTETHLPMAYKPLSPWAYFGLQLLFSLPVVGFICLIVFSFDSGNIHRRNFARSYWCSLLLGIVLTVLLVFALFAFGFATELVEFVQSVLPM